MKLKFLLPLGLIFFVFIGYMVLKPVSADFLKLKRQNLDYTILANCSVDYPKPLDIKFSYEVEVLRIFKKEGDRIKKGDLIIQLDDSDDRRNLTLASNNIVSLQKKIKNVKNVELPNLKEKEREAELSLKQAEIDLKRAKELYEAGGISKSDLEKIQNNYEIKLSQYNQIKNSIENYEVSGVLAELETQLESAKIEYENIKNRLLEKRIVSPFNGKILKINVQNGEKVAPSKVITTIIEATNWLLVMNVDQRELSFLKPDLKANVKFDSFPEEVFSAFVSYVCTQIDKEKGSCEVRLEIKDKKADMIKYGMSGYAEIYAKTFTNVMIIPKRFVNNNSVYIYKNGKAVLSNLNLRPVGEDKFITEDLNEGDIIIDLSKNMVNKKIKLRKEVRI
ncbi:MAG: efflux RND transporter periplasmic adaptor subunit [Brevinematales bacterium]|nr:efflux RND transporter periplasmic adaptor subunit [Brevinematales bacterium]